MVVDVRPRAGQGVRAGAAAPAVDRAAKWPRVRAKFAAEDQFEQLQQVALNIHPARGVGVAEFEVGAEDEFPERRAIADDHLRGRRGAADFLAVPQDQSDPRVADGLEQSPRQPAIQPRDAPCAPPGLPTPSGNTGRPGATLRRHFHFSLGGTGLASVWRKRSWNPRRIGGNTGQCSAPDARSPCDLFADTRLSEEEVKPCRRLGRVSVQKLGCLPCILIFSDGEAIPRIAGA